MLHISKRYGDSFGIADFSLRLEKGKIHGVLGERRTGKTTLARMLDGLCAPDAGTIRIENEEIQLRNPRVAAAWGIGFAGKQSPYVAGMSLTDHLLLGSEFAPSGKLSRRGIRKQAEEIGKQYGIPLDLTLRADEMTRADWLWAEILRMVLQERDILVLDEPETVFTQQEMDLLVSVLKAICRDKSAVLLLSRRPETVRNACEVVTILRPGMAAETYLTNAVSQEDLMFMMHSTDSLPSTERKEVSLGNIVLEVRRLTVHDSQSAADPAHELSFEVRAGEIVCLLGRPDHGWDALTDAMLGTREIAGGRIRLEGKDVSFASVRERLRAGIACLPRNVRQWSVVGEYTLEENLALNRYMDFQESGWMNRRKRRNEAIQILESESASIRADLDSFPDDIEDESLRLALLSRETERKSVLLMVEEPTIQVSERTGEAIRKRLLSVRANHRAVLLLTGDAEEAMGLADRILVVYEGEIMGEFDPVNTSVRELGWYMSGKWRQQRYGGSAIEGQEE